MARFVKRVVLVTGAASGLGKSIAQRFAREGAKVVIADNQQAQAAAFAAELNEDASISCRAVGLDVSNTSSVQDVVDEILRIEGALDVLCNVAGILEGGLSEEFGADAWDRVIRVNLSGAFYVTRAALPLLIESRGCVVNVASTSALVGTPYLAAYVASKAGLVGLTRSLAVEFASRSVRVNAVCPSGMDTPMTRAATMFQDSRIDRALLSHYGPKTGRLVDVEAAAAAVAFLASDEAIDITGVALPIDGAQTA